MFCGKCGTENPDGAVYCMSCGNRLDGKKSCPKCGRDIDERARFCPFCGTALMAEKPAAPVYSPAAAAPAAVSSDVPVEEPFGEGYSKTKKSVFDILGICGGALAMAAVLFSLIFVFCIGLETSVMRGSEASSMIYDYFYDRYHELDTALSAIPKDTEPLSIAAYVPTVICTVAVAAGFVLVVAFFVIAIVKFVKQMRDGTQHKYFRYAVGAYVSFLAAACIFYAFASFGANSLAMSGINTDALQAEVSFNAATLSGIVLGGVFLAAGAGLCLAARGKDLLSLKTILNCSLALAGTVLAVVAISFAKKGQIEAGIADLESNISFNISPIFACVMIGVRYIQDTSCAYPTGELVVAICAALAQIVVLVMLALKICSASKRLDGKGKGTGIIVSSILLGVAILSLVLNVVFVPMFETYMFGEVESGLEYSYAAPIVAVVLSALMLVESIVAAAFARKN